VIDITDVLPEAWTLVDDELLSTDDFRAFAFGNAVDFHAGLNADFFAGTVVADAAGKHLAGKVGKGKGRGR
jgi:hypothetical protein